MSSNAPLKPNPFDAYRDPVTGRWMIVHPATLPPASDLSSPAMSNPMAIESTSYPAAIATRDR